MISSLQVVRCIWLKNWMYLSRTFDMTNLGLLHYRLAVKVWQASGGMLISPSKYVRRFLNKFKMINCKIFSTYMEKRLKLSTKIDSKVINEPTLTEIVGSLILLPLNLICAMLWVTFPDSWQHLRQNIGLQWSVCWDMKGTWLWHSM